MSDDLPSSPDLSNSGPNQNSSKIWEPTPPQTPPPINNVDPVQSWIAQHEKRDTHGHFVKNDHLTNTEGESNPTNGHNPNIPLPIQLTQDNKYSEKNDPPLVDVKVTNPVTYFKKWLASLLKNEGIDIHIKIKPLTVITALAALSITYGAGYNLGLKQASSALFPNSSPILHRAIIYQGVIQLSDNGQYYLSLPDNTLWILRPTSSNINLANYANKLVTVKGNLTSEKNVINVTEVIGFEKLIPRPATTSAQPVIN